MSLIALQALQTMVKLASKYTLRDMHIKLPSFSFIFPIFKHHHVTDVIVRVSFFEPALYCGENGFSFLIRFF